MNDEERCDSSELPAIPLRDVREGGPLRHAIEAAAEARALRDDCLAWLPPAARHMMPVLDAITRRWLMRSHSPYVAEIAAIAAALGFSGVWFLNGSYSGAARRWRAMTTRRGWCARSTGRFPGLGATSRSRAWRAARASSTA